MYKRQEEFENVVTSNDRALKETTNHVACVPCSRGTLKYWRYACIDAPRYIALFIADNGGAGEGIRFIALRAQKRFLQGYGGSLAMSKEMNPLVI